MCSSDLFMWTLVLVETGIYSVVTSITIGGTGFAFVCVVLCSSYTVEHHVGPDEYVLATLFILCPEALLCVGGAKKRHVDEDMATREADESDLLLSVE